MSFTSSFTIPAVAAICFCLIGGTTPAYADLGDQLFKLLADDGAAGDLFGFSVAISGAPGMEMAIVGARRDDDNGSTSGSAYLFDTATGQQIAKLLPNDGAAADAFGWSVGISGTTAIVGAPGHDDNGTGSGSAYLFDTTTGLQINKLLPKDGAIGDSFGNSVAISGSIAVVGAMFNDDACPGIPLCDSGSAYLFDTTTGKQIVKLLPDDIAGNMRFGNSVAISGTIAIVGAYWDNDNGPTSGSAYLFDTITGKQLAKLLPDDGATHDWFGRSVGISHKPGMNVAIIGAPLDDDNGTDSGSAYLFDTITGQQIAKLLPDDGGELSRFGLAAAISGTPGKETAIVGAWSDSDNGYQSGSAYLFDAITGKQLDKLLPDDGAQGDEFGWSVGISGATAIIGAVHDNDNGFHSGSAYLFDAAAPGNCPWDIDDNGIVGASDLLALLANWGTDPDGPPDFDGDGNVDQSDLAVLLTNWGPCP